MTPTTTTAIGYLRVSTDEQGDSGLGLDAQRTTITDDAGRRGWAIRWATDIASGGTTTGRPELAAALDALDRGDAQVLVVAKLDRLARSVLDFAEIMARAGRNGWAIVCLDIAVDTTTPAGEMLANVTAAFAQYERRLISERTKAALARKRAQGARLGRPVALPAQVRAQIATRRSEGATLRQIATELNDAGTPTAQGGARWYPATIARVLDSIALDGIAA